MKHFLIFLLITILSCVYVTCYSVYNKNLYHATISVRKTNESKDTINVVFFDYLELTEENTIIKKDGTLVADSVINFTFIKRQKIKM